MSGEPKRYSPEFKEQAAKKVIDNSLPLAQVARELGVNDTTLGFWVKAYRKRIAGGSSSAGMPEAERVKELQRRVRDLEWNWLSSEKPRRTSRRSIGDRKYNFIDAEYVTLAGDEALAPTITQMCEWLEVSKSGYYEWRSRPQSETGKRREILQAEDQGAVRGEQRGIRL